MCVYIKNRNISEDAFQLLKFLLLSHSAAFSSEVKNKGEVVKKKKKKSVYSMCLHLLLF